ncbi:hypothetical protein E3T43_07255 [Cryobacterium sp. Hh7]|uniref:hypothetical protein n=1 Tax=Cryobacterium sp. Hh7 TaxID=1259159 RepID=UPI00106CA731|nr:hypothetical protein [Cryobacterium sp. Hh7]TFD58036.1 hypothetical protein E3T43_07255 [Cryobacterium sp. Hh7]
MEFAAGQSVLCDRRKLITDPYNPDSTTQGPWSDALTISVDGAFIASSSSTAVSSATRTQILSEKSLYCPPEADVVEGDRVRLGARTYTVEAIPEADTNPFTGWQPVQEVPLTEVLG